MLTKKSRLQKSGLQRKVDNRFLFLLISFYDLTQH